MRRYQFFVFCGVAFVGCFLGGFVGQVGPAAARAQLQTIPNQGGGQVSPNIRNDTYLFIPEGGLRLVNGQNRTLGVITDTGGNGGLVLFNAGGRPSVSIMSGGSGQVIIDANNGPVMRFTDATAKENVLINANQGKPVIKLRDNLVLTSEGDGGRIVLSDVKGNNGLRLDTTSDGGRLTLYDKSHATVGLLIAKPTEGWFGLFDKTAQTGFEASGSGTATISHDKEVLWKIPTDKD